MVAFKVFSWLLLFNISLELFESLFRIGVVPSFDCNKLPHCILTDEDNMRFDRFKEDEIIKNGLKRSNITNRFVGCKPVIDIRQDLTAVRCFGLSRYTKVCIRDFRSIKDLENYYIRTIDSYSNIIAKPERCENCYSQKVLECSGGCLAYKIKDIISLRESIQSINGH